MKMMVVMKMVVVLILSGVLCDSTEVFHEDISLVGCSDSDGENMYGLDGEEVWFADFKHKTGVDPQPSFIDHITYPEGYDVAVTNLVICRRNLEIARKAFKDFPLERDPPSSPMIYPRDQVEPGQKNILICHVTGFFPAPVTFSWTKNQENVTEGTSNNVPFINKDGTYNQFSRLEFSSHLGDIYGCTVKHLDLEQTRFWDVEKTQPSVGPAVFCGVGLTVGLLGVAAGTFFLIKGNECS
ncbi:H-2 class II histocompatibility antigen, A-U alpha chain-like [Cyclopterus lumpus]|uniref:Major histocompatibility complex class II d8.37a1 n=1 Tax=Cyclopterus lumpus TaxID=8103 RepID=A0A8C3A5U6_CYCLU|nr:H-2 class II histocompatibility antigen, A-U alpha chain-like [Cyclopterus lumpus]